MNSVEVWGGIECSVVRIARSTRNQLLDTGHQQRVSDLDRVAELGIRTLRYPVLWEMVEPLHGKDDWSWTDQRLLRLRALGIKAIAGLLHHGSGPDWTHLLDPLFPDLFADYARRVARRYPWIELYTPINEPMTTARISGLYGLWHPHGRDEATCLRLVSAECRAIAKAMKAIREVVPCAALLQTEDVGRILSTPRLNYQADYENERRWLALDLLTGRVSSEHPLYARMLAAGVQQLHLDELAAEPCLPDMIGIDYYLTSDRYLDENIERHTAESPGGNGRDRYVDIAAARVPVPENETGLLSRLEELWTRYRLPIAVTELHNGSTREEQLRWLMEGWDAANRAAARGIDIRAVTAWSLFGGVDWNSMLVRNDGYYESGAFDVRSGLPEPTVIARAIEGLSHKGSFSHPALDRQGWWRTEENIPQHSRPILLAGFGRLASIVGECCNIRRLRVHPISSIPDDAVQLMEQHGAWALVQVDEGHIDNSARPHGRGELRLHAYFADGGKLELTAAATMDWAFATHAFLDLAVDQRQGSVRLTRALRANQYQLAVETLTESLDRWFA